MKRIRIIALLLAIVAAPASADTVADWNRIALDAAARSGQPLEYNLRALAMVHVAMFETLNFIEGGYAPHFIARSAEPLDDISADAAAAAAAYHALVDLYPTQRPIFAATLKSTVHAGPGSRAIANGVATGTRIGAEICTARAFDRPGIDPWLVDNASQLRPKGGVAPHGTVQADPSLLSWSAATSESIAGTGFRSIERARTYALVSMVIADAYTAARDAEYACGLCVAAAAVSMVFESGSRARLAPVSGGSSRAERELGRKIAQYALQRYRPMAAQAGAVQDWNLIAVQVVMRSGQGPEQAARAMTMVNVAMFEALNFIEARHVSRKLVVPAQPLRMPGPAVAAAAAHQVLVRLYPEERLRLDESLRATLAKIPDSENKDGAVIQGRSLAMTLYVH